MINLRKIADHIAPLLETKVEKYLGSGSQGEAYLLSDGKVLKITNQECEYNVSSSIVGKNFDGINNIHKTFSIRTKTSERKYYAILQDFINTEGVEDEMEEFREELCSLYDVDYYYFFNSFIIYGKFNEKKFNVLCNRVHECEFVEKLEQLSIITKSCIEIGMENSDILPCNLGKDSDGNLVHFDLGYSESHSSQGIEIVLEI